MVGEVEDVALQMDPHRSDDPDSLPLDHSLRGSALLHDQDVRPLLLEVLSVAVQKGKDNKRKGVV